MTRGTSAALCALLAAATAAPAQAPGAARLRWQAGQVLLYRVEQVTRVTDAVGGDKAESKSHVNVTRRWQVLDVDAAGVATVQMSVVSLRNEVTLPDGSVLLFDSANPGKSTPVIREQQAGYVGKPLAVLRVDALGRVVEVKELKFGSASGFESEPPFTAVLSGAALAPGQGWERAYQITLEPPRGAGEKYAAVQRYACKAVDGALATVSLTTEVKNPPAAAADQVPLLQLVPEGEVVFDLRAGRLHSAALKVDKEVKGHQGEGSSYRFQSSYTVQYAGDR
jgi:hypothetical protein